ncbi:MAG: hypothetical protein IPM51_03785 [Sphingobacteriaceae bacterium]|nr:hypothetical protein [Sphingobacteriaceae bacterium]
MSARFLGSLIVLMILTSCTPNPLDIDISNVKINPVSVHRLERNLNNIQTDNLKGESDKLLNEYGLFFEHYIMNLLKVNGTKDSLYAEALQSFLKDKDISGSYKQTQQVFTDDFFRAFEPELNDCVKRFKYHFPKRNVPNKCVTCISGWNYAFAYTDSTLVTALDMYLGDTCVYYQMLQLPAYRTRFMNKNYLLPDLLRGWLITEFDNAEPTNTLAYHTIFYGRIYYALNALMPNIQDSVMLNYTDAQMQYCKKYEKNLWSYFAEKNRLYETNIKTIQELTGDGPFTGAISKECPPRIAMWVGLQIVRSYMKNNKEATLEQLMNEKDAQKILSRSKYRP